MIRPCTTHAAWRGRVYGLRFCGLLRTVVLTRRAAESTCRTGVSPVFPPAGRRCHTRVVLAAMSVLVASLGTSSSAAFGQTVSPRDDPSTSDAPGDLARGLALLRDVRDNVFSFDDPAFYWFCRFVRRDAPAAAYQISETETSVPWRFLLERPSDYRGGLVVIAGRLLRRSQFEVTNRREVGTLYQCELVEAGTRAICTVIVTADPQAIPIRSWVRTKGYFIKVRAFRTDAGMAGAGPLLVARCLEPAGGSAPSSSDALQAPGGGYVWLVGGTAALAILWLVLRRGLRSSETKEPSKPAGAKHPTGSSADFDWLTHAEDGDDSQDA